MSDTTSEILTAPWPSMATPAAAAPVAGPGPEFFDTVEALYADGHFDEAEAKLVDALKGSKSAAMIHNLGVMRAMRGDIGAATNLLDAAAVLDPHNAELEANRGSLRSLSLGRQRPFLPFNPEHFLRKLEPVEGAPTQRDASYKLPERRFPWSITAQEGELLYEMVTNHGLRSGFEIATAFGVSTMYLGNAFRQTGGHLVSMDAYIEESFDDFKYGDIEAEFAKVQARVARGNMPLGLAYAALMVEIYGLGSTVELAVGLSPRDIVCQSGSFDFAFIDGGHFGDQPSLDTLAALSFMNVRPCVIAFHDNNNNPHVAAAIDIAARRLQVAPVDLGTKYHLTAVIAAA